MLHKVEKFDWGDLCGFVFVYESEEVTEVELFEGAEAVAKVLDGGFMVSDCSEKVGYHDFYWF